MLPTNMGDLDFLTKFAAFDGDADRLIYFMRAAESDCNTAIVMDGDK
jgi:phosphomannomutase